MTLAISLALFATLHLFVPAEDTPLGPGDHTRTLTVGERQRNYRIHIPKSYDGSCGYAVTNEALDEVSEARKRDNLRRLFLCLRLQEDAGRLLNSPPAQ